MRHLLPFLTVLSAIDGQNISDRNFDSDCGQVFTKKQFILESPQYPSNYPINHQCSYLIKGPTCPTYFNLQFLDFNVENSLGCAKDRLEIDDQDALCGNKNDIKTYFSEKGTLILRFVSDGSGTGRGYRILVTRLPCDSRDPRAQIPETTTKGVPKWYTTNKDVEYATTTTTTKPIFSQGKNSKCCQTVYNSKKFTLTSPNFPYSSSSTADCVYEIHRANPNVCRLRIHVNFFFLQQQDNSCSGGYLQIDGRYICGCKSDLKLISAFEHDSPKFLHFVSRGYERNSYTGFVLDVIQDECPKRYVPETNITQETKFKFYNDQINRVAFPNRSDQAQIEKLHLISENTEVLDRDEPVDSASNSKIIKHVYFFADDDFNAKPKEREETTYVDTGIMSTSFVQDFNDYSYCLNWNRFQWNSLVLQNLPVCKTSAGNIAPKNCIELDYVRGFFKSPGYPFYYPSNLNICYRFKKLPGYCSIRVYMKDFNIEYSADCRKDYLLLGQQYRYCGSQLSNTISTFDLRGQKPFEDATFVSDAFYCGRGFFGTYEQIACQDMTHPINPTSPPPTPSQPCRRLLQDATFALDVNDYDGPTCTFIVKKYAQDVCKVRFYFDKFDLVCASEALIIGDTMYCGHLSGQSVTVDFTNGDIVIVYRKSSNEYIQGPRLHIRGIQVNDDCPYPEVPAERLSSYAKSLSESQNKFFLKFDKKFKDLCGVITNSTEINLPETFCDFIMSNDNNVTNCVPLSENSLIVPLDSQMIELKIQQVEKIQEIEFEQVDCDDMPDH